MSVVFCIFYNVNVENVANDGNASRFIFLAEHERFRIKLSLFKCQGELNSAAFKLGLNNKLNEVTK